MKKLLLLLVIVTFGCSNSREEELLEKSKEVHEAAMKIGKEIKDKIKQIDEQSEGLEEPTKSAIKDSVEALTSAWEVWESTIVEVPGHDDHDHHDHDHDHDHDHSQPDNLTPEMVLELQEDLQSRATSLNVRAENILKTLTEED